MLATTAPAVVSMTDTSPVPVLLTKTRRLSRLTATPSGWAPTAMVADTVALAVSITETVPAPSVAPDGAHAYVANDGAGTVSVIDTASGPAPVPTVATTVFVAVSI